MTIDLMNDQIFSIRDVMNSVDSDQRGRIEFGEGVFDSVKGIRQLTNALKQQLAKKNTAGKSKGILKAEKIDSDGILKA